MAWNAIRRASQDIPTLWHSIGRSIPSSLTTLFNQKIEPPATKEDLEGRILTLIDKAEAQLNQAKEAYSKAKTVASEALKAYREANKEAHQKLILITSYFIAFQKAIVAIPLDAEFSSIGKALPEEDEDPGTLHQQQMLLSAQLANKVATPLKVAMKNFAFHTEEGKEGSPCGKEIINDYFVTAIQSPTHLYDDAAVKAEKIYSTYLQAKGSEDVAKVALTEKENSLSELQDKLTKAKELNESLSEGEYTQVKPPPSPQFGAASRKGSGDTVKK